MRFYETHNPRPFFCAARGGPAPDMEIAAESLDVDTRADELWFAQHPGETVRLRTPTALEVRAFKLPPNARASVILDRQGKCWREFRYPTAPTSAKRPS